MVTTILAYLLILPFYALEFFLRKGPKAKSFTRGRFDRGSTTLISISFGTVIVLEPLLNLVRIGHLSGETWSGWIGLAMMVLGIALRFWSMRVLGEHYTRTLKVSDQQTLVDSGPYRLIRHPGYLGTLLVWIGASIAMLNWITILVVTIMMLAAYIYRIHNEEAMLLESFGDAYQWYRLHTWRLIPLIY